MEQDIIAQHSEKIVEKTSKALTESLVKSINGCGYTPSAIIAAHTMIKTALSLPDKLVNLAVSSFVSPNIIPW